MQQFFQGIILRKVSKFEDSDKDLLFSPATFFGLRVIMHEM